MLERGEPSLVAHLDNQKLSSTQAVICSCTKISTAKLETPRKKGLFAGLSDELCSYLAIRGHFILQSEALAQLVHSITNPHLELLENSFCLLSFSNCHFSTFPYAVYR